MSKPVLLLVMSQTCGACQKFKATALPGIEREIEKDGKVELLKLEFPTMQLNSDDKDSDFEYHPSLPQFAGWFPIFILFPENLWFDKGSKLKGVTKDKEEIEKSMEDRRKGILPKPGDKKYPDYSKSSIMEWIDSTLKTNSLFNKRTPLNGPLIRQTNDGKVLVPTHGTYTKFVDKQLPEEF